MSKNNMNDPQRSGQPNGNQQPGQGSQQKTQQGAQQKGQTQDCR